MPQRYKTIATEILFYLAAAGAVALAATSPFVASLLIRRILRGPTSAEKRHKFSQALWRLKRSRLIILKEKSDGTFLVELTEKGKRKTKEIQFENLAISKQKKWDGIWRIVIFDIPVKKRIEREAFRRKMKELDFFQLQKSVWVIPYPCEQEIEFLVELFGLYSCVTILEAQRIKHDAKVRKYFDLL